MTSKYKSNWIDGVPEWMSKAGIKKGDLGYLTKHQLESQMRPGPGHTLRSQLWALGMLHTMKHHGEMATIWRKDASGKVKQEPMTPGDMARRLIQAAVEYFQAAELSADDLKLLNADLREQYSKEHIRRALADLEEDGVAERRRPDGRPLKSLSADARRQLSNGQVHTYFWVLPKNAERERVKDEWRALKAAISSADASESDVCTLDALSDDRQVAMKWLPSVCIPKIFKVLKIQVSEVFAFPSLLGSEGEQPISESKAAAKLASALAKPEYQETLLAAMQTAHMTLVVKVREVLAAAEAGTEVATPGPPDVAAAGPPEVAVKPRQEVIDVVNKDVIAKSSSSLLPGKGAGHATTTNPPDAAAFHEEHVAAWKDAGKDGTPTRKQSAIALERLGERSPEFLRWLTPKKLKRVEHPGALPHLVEEFLEKGALRPEAPTVKCWQCGGSLDNGSVQGACFDCAMAEERRAETVSR